MKVLTTKLIDLNEIRLDGETQPRQKIDEATVEAYADLLDDGVELPDVDVVCDGAAYWLADGFHRWYAARRAGHEKIMCRVRQGMKTDAQWFAAAANQKHGLRRSNADKQKAVKMALANPHAEELSDSKIAEHVGVSQPTVAKYRAKLTSKILKSNTTSGGAPSKPAGKATTPKAQPTKRKGRDGRTIDTAKIGKGRKPKKPPKPAPPQKSLKGPEREAFVARQQVKLYYETIGRWLSQSPSIDDYRNQWPSPEGDRVVKLTTELYEALKKWPKAIK